MMTTNFSHSPLILASNSPRRHEILKNQGFVFTVLSPNINEDPFPNEAPQKYVERMSSEKWFAAKNELHLQDPCTVLLTADTTVIINGTILGKPESAIHAHEMLRSLSGTTHQVLTSCSFGKLRSDLPVTKTFTTIIEFYPLSDSEIQNYIDTKEPFDKAGAYAIQGLGGKMVKSILGSTQNVTGLPLELFESELRDLLAQP